MGLETLAIAAFVGGTALSIYGQYQSGRAAREASRYNRDVAELNAKSIEEWGDYNAKLHRIRTRKLMGTQRARYAASGVRIDASPLAVIEETYALGEIEATAIEREASGRAWAMRSQGNLARFEGEVAEQQAQYGMVTTLLKSAGTYGMMQTGGVAGSTTSGVAGSSGAGHTVGIGTSTGPTMIAA